MNKRYAILIGNDSYPNDTTIETLRYPLNDVNAMHKLLSSEKHGKFQKVIMLYNKDSQEINETIEDTLAGLKPDDLVLLYYAGHGFLNNAGKLCLGANNTIRERLGSRSVLVDSIYNHVNNNYCQNLILILDCCYSGAAEVSFKRGDLQEGIKNATKGSGIYIIAASADYQVAEERDDHGLLTHHILEAVHDGRADMSGKGWVSVDEVFDYVSTNIAKEKKQKPVKSAFGVKGTMKFADTGIAPKKKGDNVYSGLNKYLRAYIDSAVNLKIAWSETTANIVQHQTARDKIELCNKEYHESSKNLWAVLGENEKAVEEIWGLDAGRNIYILHKDLQDFHQERALGLNAYREMLIPIPEGAPADNSAVVDAEKVRINKINALSTDLDQLRHRILKFLGDIR